MRCNRRQRWWGSSSSSRIPRDFCWTQLSHVDQKAPHIIIPTTMEKIEVEPNSENRDGLVTQCRRHRHRHHFHYSTLSLPHRCTGRYFRRHPSPIVIATPTALPASRWFSMQTKTGTVLWRFGHSWVALSSLRTTIGVHGPHSSPLVLSASGSLSDINRWCFLNLIFVYFVDSVWMARKRKTKKMKAIEVFDLGYFIIYQPRKQKNLHSTRLTAIIFTPLSWIFLFLEFQSIFWGVIPSFLYCWFSLCGIGGQRRRRLGAWWVLLWLAFWLGWPQVILELFLMMHRHIRLWWSFCCLLLFHYCCLEQTCVKWCSRLGHCSWLSCLDQVIFVVLQPFSCPWALYYLVWVWLY